MQEAIGLMEYSLLKKETSANYNYYSKMCEKYFLLESMIDWCKTSTPGLPK